MNQPAKQYLDRAALAALRAAGYAEPNPLVGCVIVKDGRVIGIGHHQVFGGPHAEREALADCRRRGEDPAGSTVYVTLEPCKHHGKTPPCTDALIDARIARVIAARPDPGAVSGGGKAVLAAAGIPCDFDDSSPLALFISEPFVKRVHTGANKGNGQGGLPWVIAKWAQTIDGRVATRTGESQWISGPPARRRVHRLRARVDMVITGIGTVLADDPQLTARNVGTPRRRARRVVVDPQLRIPLECKLVASLSDKNILSSPPLTIATTAAAVQAEPEKVHRLRSLAAEVLTLDTPDSPGEVDLRSLLQHLAATHNAATVLVECGPGLLGRLIHHQLIDECLVYLAPILIGDAEAVPVAHGIAPPTRLADASRWRLLRAKPLGHDIELRYTRAHPQV